MPGPRSQVPASTIAKIRNLAADGHTLAEIANDLTQDQVPLPYGTKGFGRRRKSAVSHGQ
jgi:hypothetical protein